MIPMQNLNTFTLALSDDQHTVRVPICQIGRFFKGKQEFSISPADVRAMAANFSKRGNGSVVIDYEHASNNPQIALGGAVPAAGWIESVDDKADGDGIVWGSAEFNADGAQLIRDDKYRFLSPTLSWAATDRTTGKPQGLTLLSVALTNTPVLDNMPRIALSEADQTKEQNMAEKDKVMCSEHPQTPLLCPKCDASKPAFTGSEHHHGPEVLSLSAVTRKNGRIDLSAHAGVAAIGVDVFQAWQAEQVALSEVAEAVRTGRITPAQRPSMERIALNDVASFRELLGTMPQQVNLSEIGHSGGGEGVGPRTALRRAEKALNDKAMELSAAKGIPFSEGVKMAARQLPEVLRERNRLASIVMSMAPAGANED